MIMNEYTVGIDLGGTAIKYAVVSSRGAIPFGASMATPSAEGADAVISALAEAINNCKAWAGDNAISCRASASVRPAL